jgi:hypothetical protein
MAMSVGSASGAARSVADIYRGYFLRLFEALSRRRSSASSSWAKPPAGAWRPTGRTACASAATATVLQQQQLHAGILVAADGLAQPLDVQFFRPVRPAGAKGCPALPTTTSSPGNFFPPNSIGLRLEPLLNE